MLRRTIQDSIERELFKGKVIVVYGPRRVGKTTLLKAIQEASDAPSVYLNCDEPDVRRDLSGRTSTELSALVGKNRLVLIDEAQRVPDIGLTLKLFVDAVPKAQVVATGSSAFELSNRLVEPLTGRKREFHLYPFSLAEVGQIHSPVEIRRLLDRFLVHGLYPEVVNEPERAGDTLRELSRSYLFKDILAFHQVRNSEALERLIQSLALQAGSEVSYTELGGQAGLDRKTVESYLRILEQSFVVFRLGAFRRNLRNELKKSRKVFFLDTGLRNAVVNNLNPPELRNDVGALWENFVVCERRKANHNRGRFPSTWFWRSHSGQEIDYLEEEGGSLRGYEIKWTGKRLRIPSTFAAAYPDCPVEMIHRGNLVEFLGG
ncbi:MAG: ATP-binding protein [Desulfobacteria bacterium]